MSASVWIIIGILIYATFMVVQGFYSFKETSKSSEAFLQLIVE